MKTRLIAVLAAVLVPCADARAGSYQVYSCGDAAGFVNHSWAAANGDPSHLEQGTVCPASINGSESQLETSGLYSADQLGLSNGSAPGATAQWTIVAPPTDMISRLVYRRYLGVNGDPAWVPALRADNSVVPSETCSIQSGSDSCAVGSIGQTQDLSFSASSLSFGITCGATSGQCVTGASLHSVWAALYAATVTISDPVPPTLGTASGSLLTTLPSTFHNGTDTVTIPATDNVGIKQTTVYVDGQARSTVVRPCDYTYVVPCSNEPGASHQINWPALNLPDGSHTVQLGATDAAGNESRSAPITLLVDTRAPGPPTGMTGLDRQSSQRFNLAWTNPDQGQGAPIAAADYLACSTSRAGSCFAGSVQGSGVHAATITVPSHGTWRVAVWLVDAAGNGNPANAAGGLVTYAVSPRLRLTTVVRRGADILVIGDLAKRAGGRVTFSYRVRIGPRQLTLSAHATIRRGRFSGHLHLPRGATPLPGARVVVTYAGDSRYVPARASARPRAR